MSLTAANATIMLTVANLFDTPVQLQGFAADDVFDTDTIETAEVSMGVDGNMSAGFVWKEVTQGFSLQADSQSILLFDQWYTAQITNAEVFFANGVILLTAVGKKWSMRKGVLRGYKPIPDAGKILKPQKFNIVWERVIPAVV